MPTQNSRTHQHPKTRSQSALSTQKSTFFSSPPCLSSAQVERPVLSKAQRVERWSVGGRSLVGHRSFAGRLVVGHWSVGGRLVVGLKRPSATPAETQSSPKQALTTSNPSKTDIQPNCAQKTAPYFQSPASNTAATPPFRLEFQVSSFQSLAPTQSSPSGRNTVVSAPKAVSSPSVHSRLRDASGSIPCRFGAGFLTRKNYPEIHKHSPNLHLKSPPTFTSSPNTIFRTRSSANPPVSLLSVSASLRENPSPKNRKRGQKSEKGTFIIIEVPGIGKEDIRIIIEVPCPAVQRASRSVGRQNRATLTHPRARRGCFNNHDPTHTPICSRRSDP